MVVMMARTATRASGPSNYDQEIAAAIEGGQGNDTPPANAPSPEEENEGTPEEEQQDMEEEGEGSPEEEAEETPEVEQGEQQTGQMAISAASQIAMAILQGGLR